MCDLIDSALIILKVIMIADPTYKPPTWSISNTQAKKFVVSAYTSLKTIASTILSLDDSLDGFCDST